MPILPENKHRYPPDWPQIRARVLQRAQWKCEECGVHNGWLGGRTKAGVFLRAHPLGERRLRLEWPAEGTEWWCSFGQQREFLRIIRIVLTVAHLDHTPENCAMENLRAWCQRCHLAYDRVHHRETQRKRWALGDLFDAEYFA